MPAYFPLFLDVAGHRCLVVGGGPIGERKARALLECGARVVVVSPALTLPLTALVEDLKTAPQLSGRLAVKAEGRILLLKLADIDWVEAADNYVNLHAGNESHLLRETMKAMEDKLPPEQFLRISRSVIVNVEHVKELHPLFHGEYVVILRNGARLTLTRGYRDKLKQLGVG